MARYDRSISVVYDNLSKQRLIAEELFTSTKEAYAFRLRYHQREFDLVCLECGQPIEVSTSKLEKVYFKHKAHSEHCMLLTTGLTREEQLIFNAVHAAKESPRHKELKNLIGEKLSNVKGVEKESLFIDDRFIIKGNESRRPDVYCVYNGKQLVFEIQLSKLPLKYILDRYTFYQKHGIYLIWILDNFDIHDQSTFGKDIKYLTEYQNFFHLDESKDEMALICRYKNVFLTQYEVRFEWNQASVALERIKFDEQIFQPYFYNYGLQKIQRERELQELLKEMELRRAENEETERLKIAKEKVIRIVDKIAQLKERGEYSYNAAQQLIDELDDFEIGIFNIKFNLNKEGACPKVIEWIKLGNHKDSYFLSFILNCSQLSFNVNNLGLNGETAFQELHKNKEMNSYLVAQGLFLRGYKLTQGDHALLQNEQRINKEVEIQYVLYKICSQLSNPMYSKQVFLNRTTFLVIESIKNKEIVGFNYGANEWMAFINNAISNYHKHWDFIEAALKTYGLWNKIFSLDKKGTFRKKLAEHYESNRKVETDIAPILSDIYSELQFVVR